MPREGIPLDSRSSGDEDPSYLCNDDRAAAGPTLPPTDGGKDAWLFLAGSFVIETLTWGFALAFGVLQEYYSTHEPFAESKNIPTIGTTASGIMYIGLPFWFMLLLALPSTRNISPYVGLVILCGAFVASSFATTTTQLIVFQGVFYALGGVCVYAPTILFMDEWFVRRKGLAFGIMWTGTGIGGVIVPLLMDALLNKYGFRWALRAWAAIVFTLTAPALYFVKPRLPPLRVRRFNLSFLINPTFFILQLGNIVQGLGYFIPSIYLPTYAGYIGGSPIAGTMTLVAFNTASVVGCVISGILVDKCHVTTPVALSAAGATFACFGLWGLAGTVSLLFLFSIMYGLFAGGYVATWPGVMMLVTSKTSRAEPSLVYGFLCAGRGVGNIMSGPVSELLLSEGGLHAAMGYGSKFGPLIIFTGTTAFLSGLTLFARARPGLL